MVGTKGKKSKSKSKALALAPEEPKPLNAIRAEETDGPTDELLEEQTTDEMTDEINDEEEGIGFEMSDRIVDGDGAVLTNVDTKVAGMSDEDDPVTDVEYENHDQITTDELMAEDITDVEFENHQQITFEDSDEKINEEEIKEEKHQEEEEPEKDDEEDAITNVNGENTDERTNEDELEENEELDNCGFDNEDEFVEEVEEEDEEAVEEEVKEEDEEAEEEADEEDKEAEEEEEYEEEVDEEEDKEAEEEEEYEEEVDEEEDDVEEEGTVDITPVVTNTNEGLSDPEHVVVENLTGNLGNDEEATAPIAEEPFRTSADNGEDESVKEIASTAREVKIVAEKVILPKKIIQRKKLIKKPSLEMAVTVINEGKQNDGSSVLGKVGTSNEASVEGKTVDLKTEENIVKANTRMRKTGKEKSQGHSIEQEINNKGVVKSRSRPSVLNNRKNKKVLEDGDQKMKAENTDMPGSSKSRKSSKRKDSMGMIFMCNSGTKKDCYRYNVFGLPADKKDIVSKIYKGMRLFLYDISLKMMYGIYKAAGPGGYNVEPRAFNSQYPAQVRFTVLADCLPIPEEKFRNVIKDNYFSKRKFDCQLSNEQVKNLCKLFQVSTEKSKSKYSGQNQRPVETSSTRVDRKRKRAEDDRRMRPRPRPNPSREHERRRKHSRSVERSRVPIDWNHEEDLRRSRPMVVDDRYRHHPVIVYDRESYLPPIESPALYHPLREEEPPRSRIYSYEREPAIDYRDLRIPPPRESRYHVQQDVRDPYVAYVEPRVYREPVYESDTRRQLHSYAEYYRSNEHRRY